METLEKIVIPKKLISNESAIDAIYDIKIESALNQLMFKLMKSESLITKCKERIDSNLKTSKIENQIIMYGSVYFHIRHEFLNEVLERLINYRYNIMNQLNERLNNILMNDI